MGISAALLGLEAAGAVGTVGSQVQEADVQRQAIAEQRREAQLQATSQGIKRAKNIQNVLSSQEALASARGMNLASGSFKAITQKSFNAFNQDDKAAALNLAFRENALDREEDEIGRKEAAGIFGSIEDFGSEFFNQIGGFGGGKGAPSGGGAPVFTAEPGSTPSLLPG